MPTKTSDAKRRNISTEHGKSKRFPQVTPINTALKPLSVLVGEWKLEATWGELKKEGRARFEWVEGGAFLRQHWDFKPEKLPPEATWIIGSDQSSSDYHALYYDSRDVSRVVQMSMGGGVWKQWRNDPKFAQRFMGRFSEDGNVILLSLEKSINGGEWEHDFDIKYSRVG